MGFQIHWTQFPSSHWVFNTSEKPLVLFRFADFKPVLNKDDAIILQQGLKRGTHSEELGVLLVTAKTHYVLNERTVIPAAIENYDFAGRRHFLDVSLCVQLRFFTLGRRRQCDVTKYTWTDALHQAMDHSALTRGIPPLEHDRELRSASSDPLLHPYQPGLKLAQFPRVGLVRELAFLACFLPVFFVRHSGASMNIEFRQEQNKLSDGISLQAIGPSR